MAVDWMTGSGHFTLGNNPMYTSNIGLDVPQCWSRRSGEEINPMSLPEIKRRFLGRQVCMLAATPNALSDILSFSRQIANFGLSSVVLYPG